MACLELECEQCGWSDFGNVPIKQCPECGAYGVTALFDEENDHEDLPNDNTDWEE